MLIGGASDVHNVIVLSNIKFCDSPYHALSLLNFISFSSYQSPHSHTIPSHHLNQNPSRSPTSTTSSPRISLPTLQSSNPLSAYVPRVCPLQTSSSNPAHSCGQNMKMLLPLHLPATMLSKKWCRKFRPGRPLGYRRWYGRGDEGERIKRFAQGKKNMERGRRKFDTEFEILGVK